MPKYTIDDLTGEQMVACLDALDVLHDSLLGSGYICTSEVEEQIAVEQPSPVTAEPSGTMVTHNEASTISVTEQGWQPPLNITPAPTPSTHLPPDITVGGEPLTAPVDSRGIPYNETIHSVGDLDKRTKSDGSWKKKRGVDIAEVERIEKEYFDQRGATPMGASTAPIAASLAPAVPDIPVAPAPVITPVSYDQMMAQVTKTIQDGTNPIEALHLPQLCAGYGIAMLPDAVNSPDIIAAVYQHLVNGTLPAPVGA